VKLNSEQLKDKQFFSMKDLSRMFGVSISTMKTTVRWQLPKPVRVGKNSLRWSREQVETYISNQTGS
jgi:predicted DNA-binding transcriptional regulator AlpA